MSDGLITRIGKWIDARWEDKIGRAEFEELKAHPWIGPKEFDQYKADAFKELADLKTRMEKIELYAGMTRKVDPTKPAVAKSAFAM